MKISDTKQIILDKGTTKVDKDLKPGDEFQDIMDKALTQGGEPAPSPKNVEHMAFLEGIHMTPGSNVIGRGGKNEVLNELDRTLDYVDFYAKKLADPSVPMIDIRPLIDRLDESIVVFEKLASDTSVSKDLRSLASDLGVTVGKEVVKFNRGDYE